MVFWRYTVSKTKIITAILIIIVLMSAKYIFTYNTKIIDTTQTNRLVEQQVKEVQSTEVVSDISSSSQSESIVNNIPQANKPANFTEGVWIKKYPENYACFKLETPEGIKIVADPYMMNETVQPDIVTESHQHADHVDLSKLQGTYKLINETGSFHEKGVTITGYQGKHNKGEMSEPNIIFVYEINGLKIAHFASQGELPSDETLGKIKNADVLLIQASIKPQYANSKMNLEETKYIIDKLNPKIVIPEHGSENLGKALAAYLGLNVEFIKNGEVIVTKGELDAAKSLRVLDLDVDVPKE